MIRLVRYNILYLELSELFSCVLDSSVCRSFFVPEGSITVLFVLAINLLRRSQLISFFDLSGIHFSQHSSRL